MPRWLPIARDYAATRKRFSIQARIGEMLSGIVPTYQVERNWPGDQLDLWGINGISNESIPDIDGMTGQHLAGSLHNISDAFPLERQKELLVWRVTGELAQTGGPTGDILFPANKLHLMSPGIGYNPEATPATAPAPGTGIFLPWLQPQRPEEVLHFPTAGHLDVGYNPNLQTVNIGGDVHVSVGPALSTRIASAAAAQASSGQQDFSLGGLDAPPYRIQPGRKLTVQSLFAFSFAVPVRIDVSFWYSEREYAVGQ
ncbi:MAG: hypothetical protein V3T07_08870 [Myxococcota bacterium]